MWILGFDTATAATTVALIEAGDDRGATGLELELRDDPPSGERPHHATRLLGLIVELLGRAGVSWESIDRIAVGVGPGTFTGLRIGVSTARALSQSRNIPLTGISSLQALAMNACASEPATAPLATVMAVLDARRGEAFAAAWRLQPIGLGERLCDPAALDPAALAQSVGTLGETTLAIGSGAIEFRSILEQSGAQVPADNSTLHKVSALHHCRLASATQEAEEVIPQYLRLPDADLARRAP